MAAMEASRTPGKPKLISITCVSECRSIEGSGEILAGAKIGPTPRDKARKVYPCLKGAKTSHWGVLK